MDEIRTTNAIEVSVRQWVGDDRMICDAARVSTLGDQADAVIKTITENAKLVGYLLREKHGSPFEHGLITFVVTAPIFVFWDHVRHRIGVSFNIESSRYRELQPLFYIADEARTQSGKPGHYVMHPGTDEQSAVMRACNEHAMLAAWKAYRHQLDLGIAREQAMQVLPMSTVISGYVTFNPRSLMKFLELRLGPARQELQDLAALYMTHFAQHWPAALDAFETNGRIAP